ncbi:EAL domain-containing protein [Pseudothermotoga elfii]|jgi:EAL domain-containing protein (putative c-di-GMP-specific phosphodiesterase class I)|uniref:EAL domain-containing protein n=1 Tax=Pseudothermotoga elfii TaxID=38322 RepID=UPI0004024708|nr:EAL domain-containing protein [Pseudothermotoga elfii]
MGRFLPKFPTSRKKVIVFVPHSDYLNYLLHKFNDIFKHDVEIDLMDDYLSFEMEFDKFIDLALSSQEFTQIELEEITLLPLDVGETFTLRCLKNSRTFQYWIDLRRSDVLDFVLQNESLTTFFQPVVNYKTGKVVCYECLSRGIDQNGELIAPALLFDLAKRLDVLLELSKLAIVKALKVSKQKNITQPVSINFPPSILLDPDFVYKTISDELEKLKMRPEQVILELTESEKEIKEFEKFVLESLKKRGIKIAIDDFGNGFSSLERLANLKPDIIKIDMGLVRDIQKDRLKRYMVEALVSMAKKSDIQVIAEGVETKEECKTLFALGVDLMQGYLFAKPGPEPLREIDQNFSK